LSYNLEGADYRSLDAKSLCGVEPSDYLLGNNTYHDKLNQVLDKVYHVNDKLNHIHDKLNSDSWYVDLVNKLRR